MSAFLSLPFSRRRHDAALWAGIALSIVLHLLLLSGWLPLHLLHDLMGELGNPDFGPRAGRSLPLAVRLVLPTPSPSAEAVPPSPPQQHAQPHAAPRHEAAPKKGEQQLLLAERSPSAAAKAPPADAARAGLSGDFLSDLNARRHSHDEPAPPPQPAPGGQPLPLSFGSATGPGGEWRDGGIFRIERITHNDATLVFYRTNRDVQRVEVETGANLSIQLAIVRAVIAVMRDSGFTGDVNWMSDRLGRVVEISARPRDTVKLEAFLLTEFFPADPMRRPPDTAASRP